MSIVVTHHRFACDGCGKQRTEEHGPWAEMRTPKGWLSSLGFGLHACSENCREKVETAKQDPRPFIWMGWAETPGNAPEARRASR